MFKDTIYSEKVIINAPREKVWEVLLDLPSYSQWNPFTHRVDGVVELGKPVDLHVRMPIRGDRMSTEIVMSADIDDNLAWGMTMVHPLLLVARRDQCLEKINDEQCSYQTWDAFNGLLTPIVVGLFGKDMLNGFNGVAHALKAHCEK